MMVDQYIFSGSLPENASTYVTREADAQLYEGLKAGKFCYVLNSRQSGKSSLRVRTMQRLRSEGVQCAAVDLSAGGIQNVPPEQWYADLIDTLIDSFGLDVDFSDWWEANQLNTLVTRFRKFLEEVLLVEIQENIVIFIDEIDSVLSLNFATDDFFALIRACYNKRVDNPEYNRLTFCLLGVVSPINLIEDKQRTPFNIGQAISLKGFQLHEVNLLEKGLRDKFRNSQAVMQEILHWTGGQPFLTQKLCQLMVEESEQKNPRSVEQVVRSRIIENWESQDEPEHLRTIRNRILSQEHKVIHLLELYQFIFNYSELTFNNNPGQEELLLVGLVVKQNDKLKVANKIYEAIFNSTWIEKELACIQPYSQALKAWLASDCQNTSFLLKAEALESAVNWLFKRSFISQDYRFLLASQELEAKEIKNAYKTLKDAQKKLQIAQEQEIEARIRFIELENNKILVDSKPSTTKLIPNINNSENRFNKRRSRSETKLKLHLKFSVVFVTAIVSLTGIIGRELYNQPQLQIGNPAPRTIRAPYTGSIEDKKKTEAERRTVLKSFPPVMMVDVRMNQQINENLQQLLDDGNKIRAVAGAFPFFDTVVLSTSTQRYLRFCSDAEWQAVIFALKNSSKQKLRSLLPKSKSTDFTQAIAELEAYQLRFSLIAQISQARQKYRLATAKLLQLESVSPETIYEESLLLDLSDVEWENTQLGIHNSAERILIQGIPDGLPQNILQDAVSLQVQTFVPKNAEPLAREMLLAVLQPNLQKDEEKTREKAQKTAAGVPPVMVNVRYGEAIVKKGEQISAWDFEVLQHYHLIRPKINWVELVKLGSIITVAIGIFVWVERHINSELRQRDRLLVLLLTLSVPGVIVMGLPYTTWSALGLLLGSFYGPTLGLTVVGLLSSILAISLDMSKAALLAGVGGGILGSCIAQRLRSREELALLGVAIALTQGGIYLIIKILIGQAFGSIWYIVLREAGLFALSGLAWSVLALGLSPYLEKLFDLVTPIRLAELANPNRPLLKRLATETPGTFQHTLFVATLAEAAAKELGCNVELVRAGALYHDIGKMHDPLGFIENQMGGPNKHDTEIKDPWKSAEIIKKHVSEGLVMARKHLLPTAIQAFIPEAKGTMLISNFYYQAQQLAKEDSSSVILDEADFHYDGPIPQSRETGIVLLADRSVRELKSLKSITSEQALKLVDTIVRVQWEGNQLVESGLTHEEIKQITEIFVTVWLQAETIVLPKLLYSL